ncbi:MAG: hypothetical protein PVI52_04980 [Chromatiales bacterium]
MVIVITRAVPSLCIMTGKYDIAVTTHDNPITIWNNHFNHEQSANGCTPENTPQPRKPPTSRPAMNLPDGRISNGFNENLIPEAANQRTDIDRREDRFSPNLPPYYHKEIIGLIRAGYRP